MPGRLQDRVVVITGASSGIGRATAFACADEGAHVVCADLTDGSWRKQSLAPEDEADGTTHERIQSKGGKAVYVKCDVTDSSSVLNAVQTAVREYGRLDVMINNAGVALEAARPELEGKASVWEISDELFETTQKINVNGVFYGVKHAAAQMIQQVPRAAGGPSHTDPREQRGVILNAASVYGLVATAQAPAYCTSKGAVANLTRAAALDCGPHGIRVNAVCPGFVASHLTDPVFADPERKAAVAAIHPFRGIGRPEDVARMYVFLASDDAGWVSGACLPIDGCYTAQ